MVLEPVGRDSGHAIAVAAELVGLSDVIVVATSDAVLVVPKNQSEKVKDLVTTLKNSGRREATEHKRIHRPWGYYQGVDAARATKSSASW